MLKPKPSIKINGASTPSIRTTTIYDKDKLKARTMYVTADERDDILENLSSHALALYEHYLSPGMYNKDFSDNQVHKTFHYWSLARIKTARLGLMKAGYIRQKKHNNPKTKKIDLIETFLGKSGQKRYNKRKTANEKLEAKTTASLEVMNQKIEAIANVQKENEDQ